MPRDLISWGMHLKDIDYLLDLEREHLLQHETRWVDLPEAGRQRVEAFRLVWRWYDHLVAFDYGLSEDRLLHFWRRCIDEEALDPATALVRLVFELVQGSARDGINIADHNLALEVAQTRMAAWRARKAARPSRSR